MSEVEVKVTPLNDTMKGVIRFLQANDGAFFCVDIASAMGIEAKRLQPTLTNLVNKRGLLVASEGTREVENKKGVKEVRTYKMYSLSDAGQAIDPDKE